VLQIPTKKEALSGTSSFLASILFSKAQAIWSMPPSIYDAKVDGKYWAKKEKPTRPKTDSSNHFGISIEHKASAF
jgi:hypothetical protein